MKNIHVLTTDKPSRLHEYDFLSPMGLSKEPLQWRLGRNIYITSDEEIKEGDYVCASGGFRFVKTLNNDKFRTFKDDGIVSKQNPLSSCHLSNYKKIILTTDFRLAPDVQKIDDEFLEWFIKNPSCEEVEIERIIIVDTIPRKSLYDYKIIIPKEEPKTSIKKEYVDDQDAYGYGVIVKEEPKQDEIMERFIANAKQELEEAAIDYCDGFFGKDRTTHQWNDGYTAFINGAKWQQKQDAKEIKLLREELAYEKRNKTSKL